MTGSPAPPHRIVLDRPVLPVLAAAASLLLSLWAIYLDPVINSGAVSDVLAAQYFSAAQWGAGMEAARQPLYALFAAALGIVTGMSAAYSLYALNAGLYVLLTLGFISLVAVLGGDRRAQMLAALLVLMFPALNELRSSVSGDAGYWAFHVWSLAYFMHYAAVREPGSLARWALAALAALLFALEALLFVVLVPLWLYVHDKSGGPGRLLKVVALAAGGAVLAGYLSWERAWHAHIPVERLLLHPVDHLAYGWHELGETLGFRLDALRDYFLDRYSRDYDDAALLATLLVLGAAGLFKALGPVYAILAGCALAASRRVLSPGQRRWWGLFLVISSLLLLVPATTRFEVTERDAMIAALTVLAIVPTALASLWHDPPAAPGYRRWVLPLALTLVIGSGVHGLDLRTRELHLREAGLWLRAVAPPDSSLYSNSPVVAYYAGLDGRGPRSDHAWAEAMSTIRRENRPDYDYLALVIDARNAHREGILMRNIDIEPIRTFSSDAGDKVLIFDTRP